MSHYLNQERYSHLPGSYRGIIGDTQTAVSSTIKRLMATLSIWNERHLQRRRLAKMPAHLLRDIGITAYQARQEADKPFWVE